MGTNTKPNMKLLMVHMLHQRESCSPNRTEMRPKTPRSEWIVVGLKIKKMGVDKTRGGFEHKTNF